VNTAQPWAEAIAINNGKFIAVGSLNDVKAFIGKTTKIIDLDGKLVLPGFIDNHMHAIGGAIVTSGLDVSKGETKEQQLKLMQDYAKAHTNDKKPVIGYGWAARFWPAPIGPDKSELDTIFGDRAAFLVREDGHGLWMNSAAIAMTGLTSESPDPIPGISYYSRDKEGALNGFAEENAAWVTAFTSAIKLDKAFLKRVFPEMADRLARTGMTGFIDPGVMIMDEAEAYTALVELDNDKPLPFRFRGSHYSLPAPGVDHVAEAVALRDAVPVNDRIRIDILKINVDGGPENGTAVMLEPYDNDPQSVGKPLFARQELFRLVAGAYQNDLGIHMHTTGDGGLRLSLDAIAAARKKHGAKNIRSTLTHAYWVNPNDRSRFTPLNAGWSTSGVWIVEHESWDPVEEFVGNRVDTMWPTKSLVEAGTHIGWASDYPVAATFPSYNMLDQIEMGVTRRWIGAADNSHRPARKPTSEALTLEQSIHAGTLGAAWLMNTDDITGSIEIGKSADFIVLKNNIFEGAKNEIHKGEVIRTVFEGRTVFQQ
jgi:predicted amidohydrolase YtcJ